jgi:diguanylate cyclase (GGDEF)-like protein/PAS domain S-box-containing protein
MEPLVSGSSTERSDPGETVALGRLEYAGGGSFDTLCRAVVGSGELGFLAMGSDGVIVFINAAMGRLIGRTPAECIGRNVVDWIHPDELERASGLMSLSTTERPPPGMSRFRVAHSSGEWVPLEVSGASVWDGNDRLLAIYCRNGAPRLAIEEVLTMLLQGVALDQVLLAVCNVIEWDGYGTHVAISWHDGAGFRHVGTGLPSAIGGGDGDVDTLWSRVRSTRAPVLGTAEELDGPRRTMAMAAGVSEAWVVPVIWDDRRLPATITIWTMGGGRSPQVHSYGMEVARNMVELILRWTDQQGSLERAAHLDALTGLANRRVFFDTLAATAGGGAVLYCDLDRFKPVNDTLGHSAGDAVLRAVAERITHCVRSQDLVARLGGDEFAVICDAATPTDAADVAARIESALESPFMVEGVEVRIGVSIGIAHTSGALDEALVDAADGALAEAKAAGRATVRVAR